MKHKTIIAIASLFIFTNLVGCEAFVRKFTRKPKKDQGPREEMVLAPQEYKPTMSKEEQYRQYFLFWKSWQDELINSLVYLPGISPSHKKQVDCANEAIKNLVSMRLLLNSDAQKKLDAYISRMADLRDAINSDVYSNSANSNRLNAERIKRDILQDLSFSDIKKSLL